VEEDTKVPTEFSDAKELQFPRRSRILDDSFEVGLGKIIEE